MPKPVFRSQYADPSHAASSGDIVALITGGNRHINIKRNEEAGKEARRQLEKKRERRTMSRSQEQEVIIQEYPAEPKTEADRNDCSEGDQISGNTGVEQSNHVPLDKSRAPDEVEKRTRSSISNLFDEVGRAFYIDNRARRFADMHSRAFCTWSLCSTLP